LLPVIPASAEGFDAMTCADLGPEEQGVKDHVKKNKPTYPQSKRG